MKRVLATSAFLLIASALPAQSNSTRPNAANYFWGQKATSTISGTTSEFWFVLVAIQNRSYCVEAGNYEGPYGDKVIDPALNVFPVGSTVPIASNGDALEEPVAVGLPRACFIHPLPDQRVFVQMVPTNTNPSSAVTLRFVETTMFCNWFFIAGDYNAFSLIRNTGNSQLTGVLVVWRGLNGATAGSTTVTIPANGAVILNARDFVNPGVFSNGTIEIAHTGAPKQLQATTTTLSGTTGLGFDAPFESRQAW
jgi:hypothetical protein